MSMLEQINRRLARLIEERDAGKEPTMTTIEQTVTRAEPSSKKGEVPAEGTAKTVGIQVDAETYAYLLKYMERHGIKGVKNGAIHALKRGLMTDLGAPR